MIENNTSLEQTLQSVIQRRQDKKEIPLLLIIDDEGIELTEEQSGKWIFHSPFYLSMICPETASTQIADILDGVENLNTQGYHIHYEGPRNIREYAKRSERLTEMFGIPMTQAVEFHPFL